MDSTPRNRAGRLAKGAGLLAAGAAAGAVVAGTLSATAATDGTPAATPDTDMAEPQDRYGPDPVRGDEESVGADLAAQLEAAALDEVPDGTVYRVETDSGDGAYEAHMTTPDGDVTVLFDEDLAVIGIEEGMGPGGPGGRPGGHHGGHHAPGADTDETTSDLSGI
jgi:hypothetical protein